MRKDELNRLNGEWRVSSFILQVIESVASTG